METVSLKSHKFEHLPQIEAVSLVTFLVVKVCEIFEGTISLQDEKPSNIILTQSLEPKKPKPVVKLPPLLEAEVKVKKAEVRFVLFDETGSETCFKNFDPFV